LALSLAGELEVQQGKEAAEAFLRKTLVDQPSVSVAASLVLKGLQSEASLPERQVFDRLTNAEQDYRCDHCGFTGKARHWRCPGCRHWDSIHYRGDALEQSHG
jgi:lipopolysaccharide biosynthesis regulator YciM